MPKKVDRIGRRYSRLIVLSEEGRTPSGQVMWRCQCDCGATLVVAGGNLTSGNSKSCGCFDRECKAERTTTHGLSHLSEYHVWRSMLGRCHNTQDRAYADYGARGIRVCAAWRVSFMAFFNDMGPRGQGMTLERENNNRGYYKTNCRWATREEQANNKRNNRIIKCNGEVHTIARWSRLRNIPSLRIRRRIDDLSWSVEEALGFVPRGKIYDR